MAAKPLSVPPRLGVGTRDHTPPFSLSTSGSWLPDLLLKMSHPTAQLERDHVREVGGVLEVGEVHDAVVLRNVHRVGVRDAVAHVRVAIAAIPRVGHAF